MTVHRLARARWLSPAVAVALLALTVPALEAPGAGSMPPAAGGTLRRAPRPFVASWIPERPARALTGRAFAELTEGWEAPARQEAALAEVERGNVPGFLRRFVPVELEHETPEGRRVRATVWVSADYVAIGSDRDYLRMPLDRHGAIALARSLRCVLPTRKIVDAINAQADVRLAPRPLPPGPMMRSSAYYLRHNDLIERQLGSHSPGALVSGHKKDVVVTNRLLGRERVAIYGWHRPDGEPIQPLSTVHGARYADYSHGIRLVYEVVAIDGKLRSIVDVLGDPELGPVLSYEGQVAASVVLH